MKIKITYHPQQSLWLNKNIAKVLTIGLLLNNLSILSNATTSINDIPNRYQTLEGEYITIDDSEKGTLHEIEIFGNTVQDENNIEDIQSVGDLYADEDGNPILDKQGREQYKIDIISGNKNLIKFDKLVYKKDRPNEGVEVINGGYVYNGNNLDNRPTFIQDVMPDTTYTISFEDIIGGATLNIIQYSKMPLYALEDEESFIKIESIYEHSDKKITFTTTSDCKYIGVSFYANSGIYEGFTNLQLELGKYKTNYVKSKYLSKTLLLPCQLQKVGNVADRLYWDNEKGRYIIEKNIDSFTLGEIKPFEVDTYGGGADYWAHIWTDIGIERGYRHQSKIITNYNTIDKNTTYLMYWTHQLRLLTRPWVIKEGATSAREISADEYMEYANANNIYKEDTIVMIIKETPSLIETNITSKIKIPTYDKKTHLYVETENRINPTLKVTVDRINQIAREAVRKAENESTIHNVNTARNLVNQMDQGELKEELQQRLNNISTLNDLQIERKTSTSNIDIHIKSENMLSMTLSTNSILFEDYSGIDELEQSNAIKIDINSSLPYQLNAYLIDEMYNTDKSKKIDIDRLNIKDNSEVDYKEFTSINNKLILKDNCNAGNDILHNIDLKLLGSNAYEADIYKTVIKFEAEQK